MKASELRIGNWVQSTSPIFGSPFEVYPMFFRQAGLGSTKDLNIDNWEGVPLTEEWLLKFGFEDGRISPDKVWMPDCHIQVSQIRRGGACVRLDIDDNQKDWVVNCNSVHQLQNLYFALTGEELEM